MDIQKFSKAKVTSTIPQLCCVSSCEKEWIFQVTFSKYKATQEIHLFMPCVSISNHILHYRQTLTSNVVQIPNNVCITNIKLSSKILILLLA